MEEPTNPVIEKIRNDSRFLENQDAFEMYKRYAGSRLSEQEAYEYFGKILDFCYKIAEGKNKTRAYSEVFEVKENVDPTAKATQLLARKYVVLIMDRIIDAQYAILYDKRNRVLEKVYEESIENEGRVAIEASKVFLEHTKRPDKQEIEVTHTHEVGDTLADKLEETLKMLSGSKKLALPTGEVIDAVVLEE